VIFTPRREHARFCSPECRVAWNRDHRRDSSAEDRALDWSIAGMLDVTERLSVFRPTDEAAALTALAEAVWWVTIIDARLVRQYTEIYDAVLADHVAVQRPAIEGTLAGLRFVRNMTSGPASHVDFIGPPTDPGRHDGVVAAWTWKRVPELSLASLPERVRPWEMTRYRAYKAWLADRTVGEVFGRAARFLNLAATRAIPAADSGTFAGRQ
jgi:hypothetical protein